PSDGKALFTVVYSLLLLCTIVVFSSRLPCILLLFFFNDTPTTEIYTLSLHDALPIYGATLGPQALEMRALVDLALAPQQVSFLRSEEHTSELQSPDHLVCRLLLEKKKKKKQHNTPKTTNQQKNDAQQQARQTAQTYYI